MSNFFSEIERCLRLGIAFDLLWDCPIYGLTGYHEAIHVLEDGRCGLWIPTVKFIG